MPTEAAETDWIARLQPDHPERSQAIWELRGVLVRGLSQSLARRYGGTVFAEDMAQEALLKILDSLDQFEGRSRFTTWAMTIATRIGISELRKKRYQDVSLDGLIGPSGRPIELPETDPEGAPDETREQVLDTLKQLIEHQLTPRQQLAIRALLEGMPVEQIAAKMNSNRNAVYKLIHDARQQLKAGFLAAGLSRHDILQSIG